MSNVRQFLKDEIKKPVIALQRAVRFTVKFLLILIARSILWCFLFYLPILSLLLFCFHLATEKVRKEDERGMVQYRRTSSSPYPNPTPNFFVLRSLGQDLRFWISEFQHLKK